MINRITIIFLIFIVSSCSYSYSDNEFYLNKTERSFLNAFKLGDTVYYESSTKQLDKFLVLGIDSSQKRERGSFMALPAFNRVYILIKHLPFDTFQSISQDGTTKKIDTIPEQIICISKHPQKKETAYSFQFKHFFSYSKNGLGSIQANIVINGQKLTNYFVIKGDFADSDTTYTKIEQLYWTQEDGLVAYKEKNGIYWTKKSSY